MSHRGSATDESAAGADYGHPVNYPALHGKSAERIALQLELLKEWLAAHMCVHKDTPGAGACETLLNAEIALKCMVQNIQRRDGAFFPVAKPRPRRKA